MDFNSKKVMIIGLGKDGLSALKYIKKNFPASEITVTDQKAQSELTAELIDVLKSITGLKINLGADYLKDIDLQDYIIKSPGINKRKFENKINPKTKQTSTTEIFFSQVKGKVIAITGSKGKTTTSSLVANILKRASLNVELIGNIGNPVLDYIESDSADKYYVFEISSYQLEDFSPTPYISLITSFFPEHLDYHGNLEKYFTTKTNLFRNLDEKSHAIYSPKYEKLSDFFKSKFYKLSRPQVYTYNDENSSYIKNEKLFVNGTEFLPINSIKLQGLHNYENILAAIKVAEILKIDEKIIKDAITNFNPIEHRLELVGIFNEITFYNDAISTTPESTIAAIKTLNPSISTIILGGLDRGYNFENLAELIVNSQIKNIIIFPETGEIIKQEIIKKDPTIQIEFYPTESMKECIEIAYKITEKNKICLLSNASPSYNLFKNFEDKGSQYKKYIRELA